MVLIYNFSNQLKCNFKILRTKFQSTRDCHLHIVKIEFCEEMMEVMYCFYYFYIGF